MTINDRIQELILFLKDTENSFAKRIEVSTSVVFNIVNPKGRRSYPSGAILEKILAITFDGNLLSAEWLMRGQGDIFLTNVSQSTLAGSDLSESIEELTNTVRKLHEEFSEFRKTSTR
uniref:hypothetical protein n=1 Tax=Roseivirga sp. TaxID=1964215 RepID=UPI004047FC2C